MYEFGETHTPTPPSPHTHFSLPALGIGPVREPAENLSIMESLKVRQV